jgi:hypothetical protein
MTARPVGREDLGSMIWKDADLLAQPQVMCCNREPQADKHAGKSAIYTASLFEIYR